MFSEIFTSIVATVTIGLNAVMPNTLYYTNANDKDELPTAFGGLPTAKKFTRCGTMRLVDKISGMTSIKTPLFHVIARSFSDVAISNGKRGSSRGPLGFANALLGVTVEKRPNPLKNAE